MNYVIGDVHGCYDEMMAMIQNIEQRDKDAIFYFTGDFVDRGPKVVETLNWVLENISNDGKYQSVKGNHEDMLVDWYNAYKHEYKYYRIPPTKYDFSKIAETLTYKEVTAYIEKMQTLPDIIIKHINNEEFHIVHAWDRGNFYIDAGYTDKNIKYDRLWNRDEEYNMMGENIDFTIIHGHTPTIFEEAFICYENKYCKSNLGKVLKKKYSYNIDCGCVYYQYNENPLAKLCKLAAICLETKDIYYIIPKTLDFIKDRAIDLNI